MNNSQLKALAARKGYNWITVGGQLRIVFGHKAELPTKDTIARLERLPDINLRAPVPPPSAVSLEGKTTEERDAIILQMQAGSLT